jgi:predicted alpha/beta superfamily hydrolase
MPRKRSIRQGHFEELGHISIPGTHGQRRVRAYVPAAREQPIARPILLLMDGQNVFGDEGSFAGGWHAHVAVDKQEARKAIAPIVVGIDHGYGERIDELSAWHSGRMGGGKAESLVSTLASDLVPRVHARFAHQSLPGGAVIGGSSMGGLFALYAHFRRPDVFGGALCMSPSFWFANRAIFPFVANEPNPYQSRVYVDCGAREGRGRMSAIAEDMTKALAHRGWGEGGALRVMWRPDSKGTHAEKHWRRRLPKALRFFFG